MPTARTARSRSTAASRSSRRPGRRTARSSPTSRSSARRRSSSSTTSPPASAAPIADFRGSNSAPAWAPDGERLAVTLSRDGGSQLFSIGRNGGEPRRLASSPAIDTEAEYSADGRWLYFTSDRGGAPQIYRMAAGGGARRARHLQRQLQHQPDDQPRRPHARLRHARGQRLSPGGPRPRDRRARSRSAITDTSDDEHPSFAPNGRLHHLRHTGARAQRVDDDHARWQDQGSPAVPDGRSARAGVGPVRALAASRRARIQQAKENTMNTFHRHLLAAVAVASLAACSSVKLDDQAPVESRSGDGAGAGGGTGGANSAAQLADARRPGRRHGHEQRQLLEPAAHRLLRLRQLRRQGRLPAGDRGQRQGADRATAR